jgi:glycosyltransferase involved in cell wall biosynthesis
MPLVSVLMPAYNVEKFIARALGSLQGQTMKDFHIVVVNDGSTDNTLEVVEAVAAGDRRIEVHSLPLNGGVVAARNWVCSSAHARLSPYWILTVWRSLIVYRSRWTFFGAIQKWRWWAPRLRPLTRMTASLERRRCPASSSALDAMTNELRKSSSVPRSGRSDQ